MLARVVLAVVVGVVVTLVCALIGSLLGTIKEVALAVTVGDWLKHYGAVLGILAALWWGFAGYTWPKRKV